MINFGIRSFIKVVEFVRKNAICPPAGDNRKKTPFIYCHLKYIDIPGATGEGLLVFKLGRLFFPILHNIHYRSFQFVFNY